MIGTGAELFITSTGCAHPAATRTKSPVSVVFIVHASARSGVCHTDGNEQKGSDIVPTCSAGLWCSWSPRARALVSPARPTSAARPTRSAMPGLSRRADHRRRSTRPPRHAASPPSARRASARASAATTNNLVVAPHRRDRAREIAMPTAAATARRSSRLATVPVSGTLPKRRARRRSDALTTRASIRNLASVRSSARLLDHVRVITKNQRAEKSRDSPETCPWRCPQLSCGTSFAISFSTVGNEARGRARYGPLFDSIFLSSDHAAKVTREVTRSHEHKRGR